MSLIIRLLLIALFGWIAYCAAAYFLERALVQPWASVVGALLGFGIYAASWRVPILARAALAKARGESDAK